VEIRQRLANRDPTNVHLHAKLIHALQTAALASAGQGDLEAALQSRQQIIEIARCFAASTGTDRFAEELRDAQADCRRLAQM
jgi:hypothetical protein